MFLLKYNFHLFFPLPTFTPPKSDWPKCYSKPNLAEFIENKLRITATTYMKCSRIFDLCSLQYRLFTFSNSYPVPSPPPTPDPLKKKKQLEQIGKESDTFIGSQDSEEFLWRKLWENHLMIKECLLFCLLFCNWICQIESTSASLKLVLTKLQLIFWHLKLNPTSQNWPFVGCRKYHVHRSLIIRDFLDFKYSDSFPWKKVPEIPVNLVFTMYLTKCLLYLVQDKNPRSNYSSWFGA